MPQTFDPAIWRQAQAVLSELLELPAGHRLRQLESMDLPLPLYLRVKRLLEASDRPGPLDGQLGFRRRENEV